MNRRLIAAVAALVAVIAVAGPTWAYPNFAGATGGSALPDDQVQRTGTWMLAGDWQHLDAFQTSGGQGDAIHVRAVFGFGDRAELGVAWNKLDIFDLTGWSASAKVQILREPNSSIGLTVGGSFTDLTGSGSGSDVQSTSLFAVIAKQFGGNSNTGSFRAYAGALNNDLHLDIPSVVFVDDKETNIFAGLAYRTPDGRFELQGEWMDKAFGADALWGVVARWYNPARTAAIQIGWTNALGPLPIASSNAGIHIGIGFTGGVR